MRWFPVVFLMAWALCGQTRLPPARQSAQPATPARQPAQPATHARQGGPAPAASDAEIEKAFRAKLAKSKIAADGFTIRVQGGVATLEGRTDVIQHKGTATRMAKTAGARAVVNDIKISDAAREKAAGNLETGRRRAQIKRSEVSRSEVNRSEVSQR